MYNIGNRISKNRFEIKEGRIKKDDRVKLYEDERILVVVPLTHKSSCKYGANTPWCVATPSNPEHYDEYVDNGILFYFIIKSPYDYGDIKEYKFAYYHPYSEVMTDYSGWYDMSDYNYNEDGSNENGSTPDIKLIKLYNTLISDKNNQIVVDDSNWLIMYRNDIDFSSDLDDFIYLSKPSDENFILFIYINKKDYETYTQRIPYYIDIRSYQYSAKKRIPEFNKVFGFESFDLTSVFKTYFKQIALGFFKLRKNLYNPQSNRSTFIHPNYIDIGDLLSKTWGGKNPKIINIKKLTGSYKPYSIDVQYHSGEINKDIYYDNEIGLSIVYDKIKHNPTKL